MQNARHEKRSTRYNLHHKFAALPIHHSLSREPASSKIDSSPDGLGLMTDDGGGRLDNGPTTVRQRCSLRHRAAPQSTRWLADGLCSTKDDPWSPGHGSGKEFDGVHRTPPRRRRVVASPRPGAALTPGDAFTRDSSAVKRRAFVGKVFTVWIVACY